MSESLIEIDAALVAAAEPADEVKATPESETPLLVESNNKRRLEEDDDLQLDGGEVDNDDEEAVRSSRKKFCTENDTLTAGNEQDNFEVNDTEKVEIVAPAEENAALEVSEADAEPEQAEEVLVEIPSSQDATAAVVAPEPTEEAEIKFDLDDSQYQQASEVGEEAEDNEEEYDDEEIEEEEDIFDSDDSDDEQMMSRVMQNTEIVRMGATRPVFPPPMNDEPIELDDSDDDNDNVPTQQAFKPTIKTETEDDVEEEDFPTDNNVLAESEPDSEPEYEESDEEEDMITELRRNHLNKKKSHTVELKEKLVKRSVKQFAVKRFRFGQDKSARAQIKKEELKPVKAVDSETRAPEKVDKEAAKNGEVHEEPMEVEVETPEEEPPIQKQEKDVTMEPKSNKATNEDEKAASSDDLPKTNAETATSEMTNGKSSVNEKSPVVQATEEALSLLDEIGKSSVDDVFTRHASKYAERTASLDEFSEELFNCLQLNKVAIDKATREWNAKLHMKFKIRQLMERVRRHRAVMEIETFGYKPESGVNNIHPIISSKSSTTTNSEGDHFEKNLRLSNESVNRLIQDVRASIIKRDEQQRQRVEDSAILSESAFDNNSWSSLQMGSTSQGRQGQIVDVQSIINDFRQRNPQEIPRRGRRVKSLNHSYFDGTNPNHDELQNDRSDYANFSGEYGSRQSRSSDQFPEVSLHPVHQNLYHKNNLNVPGEMSYGGGAQKSSLLQSILTKSTTKTPIGFQASTPSTSTLARLLTAPERSLQSSRVTPKQNFSPSNNSRQSTSKVHNGEITITPINCNRSKDFSMDDEDNSMEPPLVIDENFDGRSFEDKKSAELLCQGCKKNKAFFMCAGCSRQWYCSKECQESAWDGHSLYCSI